MELIRSMVLGRWVLLLAVLPYAILLSGLGGTGGVLSVAGLGAGVLFVFAALDLNAARRSGQVRFAFTRGRGRPDVVSLERARLVFGVASVVLGVAMLFVAVWPGVALLVGVGLFALFDRATGRPALSLIEVDIPLLVVVLPLAVAGAATESVPSGAVVLCVCGAMLLAGYIELCLIRDAQLDLGEGRKTTATVLGTGGAGVMFFMLGSLGVVLAMAASGGLGVIHWSLAALVAIAAMGSLWLATAGAASLAVGAWLASICAFAVAAVAEAA